MTREIEISPFGYPILCVYEWDAGEPAILFGDNAHPGSASGAVLIEARVGGHDVVNELRDSVIEYIEAAIKTAVES
jgi:hypothetical protein